MVHLNDPLFLFCSFLFPEHYVEIQKNPQSNSQILKRERGNLPCRQDDLKSSIWIVSICWNNSTIAVGVSFHHVLYSNYFWWSLISDHFQMGGWCEVVTNPVSCIFGGVKYIPSADSDQPWHCSHREVQPEWSLRTSCVSLPACAWQLGKTLQHSFLFCHISSRIYNLGGHVSFLSHLCNVKTVDRECFIL